MYTSTVPSSGSPKHFVLDTTEVREQRRLESSHFSALIHARKLLDDTVSIPETVLLEYARHIRSEIASHYDSMKRDARELGRILDRTVSAGDVKVAEEGAAWEAWMRGHLPKLGVQVLPIPELPHAIVLQRDLKRRKPFDEDGKGYRDTLIWESVLAAAERSSAQVVFVSRNHKDFAQKNGQLHPDLVADLVARGMPEDRVVYANGLKDVVEHHLFTRLPAMTEAARVKLEVAAQPNGWLKRWVEQELARHIGSVLLAELPPEAETGHVTKVKSVDGVVVTAAREVEGKTFAELEARITADLASDRPASSFRVDPNQSTTMSLLQLAMTFMSAALLRDVKMTVRFAATITKETVDSAEVWDARLDPKPSINLPSFARP